ncbi:ankyrin repeat domain-containing protein [Wolbachia endosymbiont (group E) of Neria commutata]
MTLLLLAAEYGNLDIVRYIIDKGIRTSDRTI